MTIYMSYRLTATIASGIYGHENEMYNVGLNLKEVERL